MREFVWATEMSDPVFHWKKVKPLIEKGEPVVIYTKGLLPDEALQIVSTHQNVALSITVTGWGGSWLEPGVPGVRRMTRFVNMMSSLIDGDRIKMRIDPVIPTNEGYARAATVCGMLDRPIDVVSSIIQFYKGHDKLFQRLGIDRTKYHIRSGRALYPDKELATKWLRLAYSVNPWMVGRIQFCGMPYDIAGSVHTGCIDEKLLQAIGVATFRNIKPGKQRPGCKCVIAKKQAISGKCGHGCLYCYAHKENMIRV